MLKTKDVLHYYLPYKLRCNAFNDECLVGQSNKELYRIETGRTDKSDVYDYWYVIGDEEFQPEDIKPILHPLSSAFNELSEFIYETQAESFDSLENAGHWFKIVMHQPLELPFNIFEKALSLHCDLFGLIESGQAIEK